METWSYETHLGPIENSVKFKSLGSMLVIDSAFIMSYVSINFNSISISDELKTDNQEFFLRHARNLITLLSAIMILLSILLVYVGKQLEVSVYANMWSLFFLFQFSCYFSFSVFGFVNGV